MVRLEVRDLLGWQVALQPEAEEDGRVLSVRNDVGDAWETALPPAPSLDQVARRAGQDARSVVKVRGQEVWEGTLFLGYGQPLAEAAGFEPRGPIKSLHAVVRRNVEILAGRRLPLGVFGTSIPLGSADAPVPLERLVTIATIEQDTGMDLPSPDLCSFEAIAGRLRRGLAGLKRRCPELRSRLQGSVQELHYLDLLPGPSGECEIDALVTRGDALAEVRWTLADQ